ncbi:MAG: VTT domain-containing protein [Candidatus Hermodarchaeota archaeon]
MGLKRIDYVFIFVLCIITIISIDFIINESHRVLLENISRYPPFQNLGFGLLITFIICLIGNLIPFPTPYPFVLCYSSLPFLSLNVFLPLLVGFIASIGSLVGEMGGYLVGRGISGIITEVKYQNLKKYQQYLITHPKIAPFLIFIFGLTPLNDDLIMVPLGIIRYDFKKTVFWCWLGKLGLMLIFSYNLMNLCTLLGGDNWILSIITLYLVTIFSYVLLKFDIIEYVNKIFRLHSKTTK